MKILVLQQFPDIDYALIARYTDDEGTPKVLNFVAAFRYDEHEQCWGQGHYFDSIVEATEYIKDLQEELSFNEFEDMLDDLDLDDDIEDYQLLDTPTLL